MANEFQRLLKSISNSSIITLIFMVQIESMHESILTIKVTSLELMLYEKCRKRLFVQKPLLNNTYFTIEFHSNTKRDFISENHFFGMPTLCHMIIHHRNWWFHSYKQCGSRSGAFLMWYSRCALVANKNGDHI